MKLWINTHHTVKTKSKNMKLAVRLLFCANRTTQKTPMLSVLIKLSHLKIQNEPTNQDAGPTFMELCSASIIIRER